MRKTLDWAYKIALGIFAGAFMWVIFTLASQYKNMDRGGYIICVS